MEKRRRRSWLEIALDEVRARGIQGCIRLDGGLVLHDGASFSGGAHKCERLTDLKLADLRASARDRRRRPKKKTFNFWGKGGEAKNAN